MSGPPVVVVGASAGGLAAFQALLEALPSATGLAFIFVQHLDPKRPTMLAEILPSHTSMRVEIAAAGTPFKADTVYIAPQGPALRFHDGAFTFDVSEAVQGAIDTTMRSAAHAFGASAVGVVLSGGGTDGTQGLAAIRLAGGTTFAQVPEEAEVASLPLSAVSNGAAEFVLPVADIAEHIRVIATMRDPDDGDETDNDAYDAILEAVRKQCSLDFRGYRRSTLERRIRRRAAMMTGGDMAEYARRVEDEKECAALRDDLLINVTRFFRDPEMFEAVRLAVLPSLVQHRGADASIRIWVPACSTGEEVYTWAMILAEALGPAQSHRLQIFGTDVDAAAIEVARAGTYDRGIVHHVTPERLEQFFVRTPDGYRVTPALRELCVFAPHNLLADPPFLRIDLISCRNLLIYLSTALQEELMPVFNYALVPDGVLVLGSSETIRPGTNFEVVDERRRIYRRGGDPAPLPRRLARRWNAPKTTATPRPAGTTLRTCETMMLRRYAPPGVLVDDHGEVVRFFGETRAYLGNLAGEPTRNVVAMAAPPLGSALAEALQVVRATKQRHQVSAIRVREGDTLRSVDLDLTPIPAAGQDPSILITFAEPRLPRTLAPPNDDAPADAVLRDELEALHLALEATNAQHLEITQGMEMAQDALTTANEELQSTNEELTSTTEELEASMEEVGTVNEELRNRNEALRATQAFAESLFERTRQPMLVLDEHFRIASANPAFLQLVQATRDILGQPLRSLGAPWDAPRLAVRLEAARDGGVAFDGVELEATRDRTQVAHTVNGVQTISPGGARGVLLGVVDITGYRLEAHNEGLAGRALGSAIEADTFTGLIAHEVRTPLRVITGFVDLLGRGETQFDSVGRKALEEIRYATERLNAIAAGLVELSRVTRMGVHARRVDVAVACFEAIDQLRRADTKRHVAFECPSHLFLQADPYLVEMLVETVLREAWAATYGNEEAVIKVEPYTTDGRHGLSVSDNGNAGGGDEAFVPFAQGPAGNGVGLALVARIAASHGGFAQADSLPGGGRVVRAVLMQGPSEPSTPSS